jgi:chlorobactene glucosyltransferase
MQSLYHFFIFLGLLLVLFNVLANVFHFDGLYPVTPPADGPLVSILVPARNEVLNIEECLRSLLLQDYPRYELIVLDDHSDDRTAEIASRLIDQVRNPRIVAARLIRGQALPDGWTGKNWACHQLAEASSGDFLFFTDADTIHAPGTVSAAVEYACRNQASLVSAWPHLLTGTFGEALIVPSILLVGFGFCPIWLQRLWQRNPRLIHQKFTRHIGAANGQFMFFTREAYVQIGGHAAVRGHVVDDVTLGRQISERMSEGFRLFNCDSLQFTTCRMYRSFGEAWAGFTKNMRAIFDENRLLFWVFAVYQILCLFLPCVFIFFVPPGDFKLVATQIGVIYFIRLLLVWRFRTGLIGAILHPLSMLCMILIGLNSWRHSIGRGVAWKGRTYRPQI